MKKYFIILFLVISLFGLSCENLILGSGPENTPENNFELLWKEFDRYYPSFQIKNINWDSLHSVYRDKISSRTSESELWDIISEMLYNFNDIHVYMFNENQTKFFTSSHYGTSRDHQFDINLVETKYLLNRYKVAGNGNFVYGKITADSTGYLYIKNFDTNGEWIYDIDKIINELSVVNTLIVDIRDNNGGFTTNGLYIAQSFIKEPLAYLQEISRNGTNHNDFTNPVILTIYPRLFAPQFNKRTILLTNRKTASVAEEFSVIFRILPFSEQIGEPTAGGLEPSGRTFQLPNGWTYNIPGSLLMTLDGHNLENVGVIPDIYARNTEEEILNGYDHILETSLQHLSKK